jgi:hypothetical protein
MPGAEPDGTVAAARIGTIGYTPRRRSAAVAIGRGEVVVSHLFGRVVRCASSSPSRRTRRLR